MNFRSFVAVVRTIASTIPFIALAMQSRSINFERKERRYQFIMPVLAVIYCIPAILTIDRIASIFIRLTDMLSNIVRGIPRLGEILSWGFSNMYSFFHTGYGIQFLCNVILMSSFCLFKRMVLPFVKKLWIRYKKLYKYTSGMFYKEYGDEYILRNRYDQMRVMLKVFYYTMIILGSIAMAIAFVFSESKAFAFPFYPIFGVIVIGEILFFLDGTPRSGMSHKDDDDESTEKMDVKCGDLLNKIEAIFKDRIFLADQIPEPFKQKEDHNWEEEFETEDSLSQITGTYFAAMQHSGEILNPDYVNATNALFHHNSVLIYNPFYKDMMAYLQLPIFHELLNNHSVLFICGRSANEDKIKEWIVKGIEETTNLPKLWKIETLSAHTIGDQMPDIGILGFRKLYDLSNMRENEDFFKKTTLIVLLEPSNILGTGQIGLRSVLQFCEMEKKGITYCALDRNADGLVDALSHVLRQSITEVIAAPVPDSHYCRVFWQAEGSGVQNRILPRISHYLGLGGEIGAFAMHEGIENIHWFSGSKMPLLDLRWNIQQYYSSICQYIHSPKEQSVLDNRFHFHEDLWQAEMVQEAFVLVEDEFCNLFEMSRTFASRIQKRGMVNVLSENYMLRDYMLANDELFTNDPKAIPSIVPDYARTERNFVLRTIMLMAVKPLDEKELSRELSLHGNDTLKPYERLVALIQRHTGVQNVRIQTQKDDVWVGGRLCSRFSYSVDSRFVEDVFDSALKTAYYLVENEKAGTYLMGNRLMGHIEQTLLPGQFFSFDGKYYQVRSISAQNGIIVRRAADHLNGRYYYRQLRTYLLENTETLEDARNLRGIKLQNYFGDIAVETDGYLEMKSRNGLTDATLIRLEMPVHRKIIHKEFLRVDMPDASTEVRYTLCVMMNELFQTIFPNEAGYLVAVPGHVADIVLNDSDYDSRIRAVVPALDIDEEEDTGIYFIEDSAIDLGLLVAVDRNFQRIMEIAADYLDWYLDPNRKHTEENVQSRDSDEAEEDSAVQDAFDMRMDSDDESDVDGEDEELYDESDIEALHKIDYLTYGYEKEPEWLALKDTLEYLNTHRFNDSNLQRTRKAKTGFDEGSDYDPNQPGQHYCDFCGMPLEKGQYTVLKDGRERCPECSKDAIKTRKQFKKLYKETVKEMENIFDIKLDYKIKVRMASAKKVNEPFGEYKPGPRFDCRVLGYASGGKSILVENGAPKWKTKSTLVHELTHIWQHHNWDQEFLNKYGQDKVSSITMEGMAVWAEIQYLISMGEKERAIRYKRNRDFDSSIYGVGMKKFLEKYPIKERVNVDRKKTPFGKFPKIKV